MPKKIESLYTHWKPLDQAQFNELMLDFNRFCEEGSMIIDKNGVSVPMKLNEAQEAVAHLIIPEVFAEVPSPTTLFIHKSRQMGISTVIAKIEQFLCSRKKNLNTQHVMPAEPDADDLCDKKFVPQIQGTHPTLVPETHQIKRRVKFLEFGGVTLNSSVSFMSSEKHSPGHGQTNQVVIEDEHAFYGSVERLEKGLIATMPKVGLSLRVVVSTANGMNHFYDLSKVAQKSEHWKYLFLPWHMLKEYEMDPTGRLKDLTHLTEYELKLCDIFEKAGYPVESWPRKMQWYQFTFETEAKLDENHMFANYPSTPEESFSATGSPVLPEKVLHAYKEANKPFKYVEVTQDIQGKASINETVISTIKQFEKPIPGHKYVIGADPADGGADGDHSSAVIIDLTSMNNVCCIKEKLDQNEFAELLNHLGRYYNNASIVPERNTGQTLIDWLVMLNYPNIFIDALHTTKSRVVRGIYTTTAIKNDAIRRLKFLMNAGIYTDYDPDFIEEGLHFTWKKTPSGIQKAVGSDGHGDDCVLSRLIAIASINMSKYKEYNSYGNNEKIGR